MKPKVAVVAVANHFESGGERWETLLTGVAKKLEAQGFEVTAASKMVWDAADAIEIVNQFKTNEPDILVIVHVTWVCDTIQYLFLNNLKCPTVLWAIPYTETFSLGCVQHFGSILVENGISFDWVYGLPEDEKVVTKVKRLALSGAIAAKMKNAKIALIGPRQTWRVSGPQDMSMEEWDFSKKFGTTIVHIEMDELISAAEIFSDGDADAVLDQMKKTNRIGTVTADESRMRYAAKVYMGVKKLFGRYDLTAAAAECYPMYSGLVNVPSSWLSDECIILDTEGDIGHTFLMTAMYEMGVRGPVALGEIGGIDYENSVLELAHEGSTAHSMAEDVSKVHIQNGGDGTMVGVPFKPLPAVTLAHMCGTGGNYRMMIMKGSTLEISHEKWASEGSKLLVRAKVGNAEDAFNKIIAAGLDHHILVKEGDVTLQLEDLCNIFGIKPINI